MECTYPSMKGDFQEPFVAQPACIYLCRANVQGDRELNKRVSLSAEALVYQVN